ncbi:hypothetical protein MAR_001513 [Mya arenaria]|uniref:Lysosome-associated membrane glycoprotein 5 n=1 Tax=Mya arenaria TaxID=6604 RepID=A0ABY7FC17_MYAAR|nr:uncharacterized protein LOC128207626 [Mya arenaria]WAR19675.1 hypothetical protein MAR_001513 [Mya arenaria]
MTSVSVGLGLFYVIGLQTVFSELLDAIVHKEPICQPGGTMAVNVSYLRDGKMSSFSKEFNLTSDGSVVGDCNKDLVHILLNSDDGKITFDLQFENINTTKGKRILILHDVTMYSVHNNTHYERTDIQKRDEESEDLVFKATVNASRCDRKEKIVYRSTHAQASMVFTQVRLAPLRSFDDFPLDDEADLCPHDLTPGPKQNPHGHILVPVLLGISLMLVVVLLATGYFVHKKIEGMGYINMP